MHAFDVLGDPVRRRILELLADGELSSGALTAVVQAEFGISQPAVSQHLRCCATAASRRVRPDGARRLYAVDSAPLHEVDAWLDPFRRFWEQRLDSLGTELARGKRERRLAAPHQTHRRRDPSHDRHRPRDRSHPAKRRHRPAGRRRGPCRPHQSHLRLADRGRLGRPDHARADQPLVPADQRRLPARRPIPAGGQRRRRDPRMRPAAPVRVSWVFGEMADAGPASEVERAPVAGRSRIDDGRARAHRDRARRVLGPVRPGRRGRRLGRGAFSGCHSTCAADPSSDPIAWQLSDEGREFFAQSSAAWGAAYEASGADPDAVAKAVANTTAFYAPDPETPS